MEYKNTITQKIFDLLSPVLGASMTRTSIDIHSKNAGSNPDSLTLGYLPKFADSIRKSLVVFLGSDGAEKIAKKISSIT